MADNDVDQDQRGKDGTPAEGRRNYDTADSQVNRMDSAITRIYRIGIALAFLCAAAGSGIYWLGARGMGPGTRTDQLQARVDHIALRSDYEDSVFNVRLTRLERMSITSAYQMCMQSAKHTDEECNSIFMNGSP